MSDEIKSLRKEQIDDVADDMIISIRKLCAKDAMIKPFFLYPDESAKSVLKKLRKEHVNSCLVVTKDKKFVGKIGDNDIIRLFLQQVRYEPLVQELHHGYRRKFVYKTAKDMINKNTLVAQVNTPINEVIEMLFKEDFEYLPVINSKEKVVGVITPSSLIGLLKDF